MTAAVLRVEHRLGHGHGKNTAHRQMASFAVARARPFARMRHFRHARRALITGLGVGLPSRLPLREQGSPRAPHEKMAANLLATTRLRNGDILACQKLEIRERRSRRALQVPAPGRGKYRLYRYWACHH